MAWRIVDSTIISISLEAKNDYSLQLYIKKQQPRIRFLISVLWRNPKTRMF